jgi:hypothetical protein
VAAHRGNKLSAVPEVAIPAETVPACSACFGCSSRQAVSCYCCCHSCSSCSSSAAAAYRDKLPAVPLAVVLGVLFLQQRLLLIETSFLQWCSTVAAAAFRDKLLYILAAATSTLGNQTMTAANFSDSKTNIS